LSICGLEAKFVLLNTRDYADQNEYREQSSGPKFDLENTLDVRCLGSADDCSQEKHEDSIAAISMVLPNGLGILFTTVEFGSRPHGEADKVLQQKDNGGDDTKVPMDRVEMWHVVGDLVDFNDDDAGSESQKGKEIERSMDPLANTLLLRSVRGLQGEYGLNQDQNAERLSQGMAGEKVERFGEYADPYEEKQENSGCFRNDTST
jgi:hypothetical protein